MSAVNVMLPESSAREFERLLWDYQRSLPKQPGQLGVSLIYPPKSGPDVCGNVTYCGVAEESLRLLKARRIPHEVYR